LAGREADDPYGSPLPGKAGDAFEKFLARSSIAAEEADEMGRGDSEGGGEVAGFEAAGEPEAAEKFHRGCRVVNVRVVCYATDSFVSRPPGLRGSPALFEKSGEIVVTWKGGESEKTQDSVSRLRGGGALGAFDAVELGLGEAEEVGGLDEGEVVAEPEGAETEAEVARRPEDKLVERSAVVGGVLLADEDVHLVEGRVEEEVGVEVGEEVEEAVVVGVAAELEGVAPGEFGGVLEDGVNFVGREEETKELHGGAVRKGP